MNFHNFLIIWYFQILTSHLPVLGSSESQKRNCVWFGLESLAILGYEHSNRETDRIIS